MGRVPEIRFTAFALAMQARAGTLSRDDAAALLVRAARDLALAEGILTGRRLSDLSPDFGLTPKDLMARWKVLMPTASLDAQEKLVTRLRAEVAGEDAA